MLCESGIVPLLLQSLVLSSNSSSAENSAVTARIFTIVAMFNVLLGSHGCRIQGCQEFLRDSGVFESLITVIPHLQTIRELTELSKVAGSLSLNSTIPTPIRLAMLAQV